MANFCECCGKKNSIFTGNPFWLSGYSIPGSDDKLLCHDCARPIRDDINNLYYTKSIEEFEVLKNQIILTCKKVYSDNVTGEVIALIGRIYSKLSFAESDEQTAVAYPVTSNVAESTEVSFVNFDNNGGKIKALAKGEMWVGIIASIFYGIFLIVESEFIIEEKLFSGFMVIVFGPLASWVSSWVLYGFGQLVENSDKLVERFKNNNKQIPLRGMT